MIPDDPRIHPVILSGGVGSRLWPLSRALSPKQLLPLCSERSMLVDTALRVGGPDFFAPTVICNDEHRFMVAEQLREQGITPRAVLLEPVGKGTAPAAAIAALSIAEDDPGALMMVMPSDHRITDPQAFGRAVTAAAAVARQGWICTFAVRPDRPETGYGYIQRGEPLSGAEGVFEVAAFREKPDPDTAEGYLDDGGYFWNSGVFLFRADVFLEELETWSPELLDGCRQAFATAHGDMDFQRFDAAAFEALASDSIDYAVMERTARAAMVPVEMGWSDVGAWEALWEAGEKDGAGNVAHGDVMLLDAGNCYVRAEGRCLTAVVGVDNVVVVVTDDAILVCERSQAQRVKEIVAGLQKAGRPEYVNHRMVYRPWGAYCTIEEGPRFQVKQITVKPGESLSLQYHHHRAEHWVIVEGTARVTRGDETFLLHENESTFIPIGETHRLENPGRVPLRLIEVQSGCYLGEDDIVRLADVYARTGTTPAEATGK